MTFELTQFFLTSALISLATFGGGAQALFYQFGVTQNHWVSSTDLSTMFAFGYATPGPAVFGTATFIGYKIGGFAGAFAGTVGVFIVPFVMAVLATRYLNDWLQNRYAKYFVVGVGLAATGVVAATALHVLDVPHAAMWQFGVAALALVASLAWKVHPLFVLLAGLVVGLAV
jgi:chromate transporter